MKHTYKVLALLFFILCSPLVLHATHVVGGSLTYTYNGGSSYTVTLKLYRDCGSGSAALPATVTINVSGYNGLVFTPSKDFNMNLGTVTNVPSNLDSCAVPPNPMPCVQEGIYTTTVNNLPPNPGGYHLYYQVCCRNLTTTNVNASCNCIGGSIYAYIPGYTPVWFEDFTLANGTTIDAGATAWTRTLGATPPTSAQVNANLFEVIGANNGQATWTSQVINIASYTSGVRLSADLTEAGNMDAGDSIKVFYSLNGGPLTLFPTNGSIADDFTSAIASTGALVGNTIQITIRARYDNNSPTSEIYRWDNVVVSANDFVSNSNPSFSLFPPLFLCAGTPFTFNHFATDADGDQLVYSFYTPYTDVAPTYSSNTASFSPVIWQPGYSATNPLGGAPLTLNSSTGMLSGTPSFIGQFVVGVKVQEYRNSVLLSEMTRDFQFNVVNCPVPAQASINATGVINACNGLGVTFPNNSSATANNFWWNFGDPSTVADTSVQQFPTFAYSNPGTYTAMLIINKGTPCADTATATVYVGFVNAAFTSTAPQCPGVNVSFTNTTTTSSNATITGWQWNFGDAATSTAQNPMHSYAAGGTYNVQLIASSNIGCVDTAIVPITINPTPTVTASSNSPVCSGTTLNLSATSFAGATYSWTGPNGFTSSTQTPSITTVTTAATGTYSVVPTANGCVGPAATTAVIINATPAAPTAGSNSPLCIGATLNLTANTIAGATYSWTGPNGFTSASQNPSLTNVTAAAAGTYSVTATVNGCISSAGTVTVTVAPVPATPTAGSNSPICAGSTLSLTANTVAGATYSWTGPNGFTSSLEDPSIAGATTAATGTYSVTVTVGGCTSAAGTVASTVNPIPATPTAGSNSPVCVGQTINLSASTIAGATYSWTGPGAFASSLQNPTRANATAAMAGTYTVTATVNGCTSAQGTVAVTVNPTPAAPTASSNSPVCAGTTLNLSANTIAGATYSWTGPNSFSSSLEDPTIAGVTAVAAGTYTVNVTVGGCTSANATTAVTVNPIPAAPTASSNSPVCTGTTLLLSSTAIAGATYTWSGPNGFTASAQNTSITSITLAAAGTYSVTATVNGCTGPAGTVAVTVNQTPSAPTASSNSPVCSGTTLNLSTANIAGATYTWTGPNGFSATLQNPSISNVTAAAAGTYSVTATVAGCTGTAGTTAVTVNVTPAAPTASSNSPICVGATLNLTASAIAGATYSWTGPNGFTSSSQNASISGATAAATGTYSVTATVNGCTGPAGTVAATINSAPATPTAGSNSPVCTGTALNLTASTIAGATYSWTGPNGFVSTSQNPIISNVTLAANGTYSVTANNGCASNAATVTVTVNATPAAPTASSNTPLCAGNTLNLTASSIAGATYSWTGPNGFTSSVQNPSISNITVAGAGTYSVTATVNGCTGAAGTAIVVVNPIPAAPSASSNTPVCTGTTLSLSASAIAGATYSWTGPNGFTSSVQNPTISNVTLAASGTYSVTATVSGCTGSAGTVNVTVNPTPAAPTASSNSPICAGSALNLSASTVAGATYSWTGPGSFTSAAQNPSIANAATTASGTYSVTVTVNGCTGAAGTTAVTVNPVPVAPTAGNNGPLCEGATLNLTASAVAGAAYTWSGPNGFTASVQNPTLSNITLAGAGTYSVTVTVAGCTSSAGITSVTVNPVPSATTATSNSPVCSGSMITLQAGAVPGATYSWTGPGGFTSTSQNPVRNNSTVAMSGTYSVTVTVNGCTSSAATTSVTVNQTPAVPVATNNGPLCVGATLNLNATSTAGSTYSWTGPNGFTASTQAASITGVTTAAAGTYSVTASANGCTSAAGTTTVIVNTIPAAPVVSSNSPVCQGTTIMLFTDTVAGSTYSWTGPASFTSTLQNPTRANATIAMAGTYTVTRTVNGCGSSSSTVSVIVNPTPATPTATSNTPVCSGDSLILNAATVAGASYTWTGPNGFTASSQNTGIGSVTTAAAGTYSVTATVNGCTGLAGTATVVINTTPSSPTAGSNSPICVNTALNLTASTVAGATYSWTGPNGFTSSLQNPGISNATLAASGTYSVTATVNGCTSLAGTVSVSVNNSPVTPVASSNSPVCATFTLDLFADTIPGATYTWSGPNGFTSTLQNPTISNVTAAAAGTYSVTAFNGCASNAASVTVTVLPTPAAPSVSSNSPVCLGSTLTLSAGTVAGATYSWTGPNGFTASTQNTSVPNMTSAEAGTYSVTVTVNGCTGPAGTVNAVVDQPASVNAGIDQTVCANNAAVTLSGIVGGGTTTGQWSTSGTGTFLPGNTSLSASYTPSAADTAAGSVTITLTSTNNGACPAVNDAMVITITNAPVANAGTNQTVCANNAAVTLNGSVSTAAGGVWSTSGTGTFSPDSTALNATYTPSAADTAAGTVTLTLTTTGNGSCLAATGQVVITITDAPNVNPGSNISVCRNNPNVSLNGSVSGGATTGTWSTSGTGTFSPNASTLNATYVPSSADTSAGSVVLTLTSSSNGNCTAVSNSITVTFSPQPVVNAGTDQSVCANNAAVSLAGSVISNSATGIWTSSGTGTFAPNDSTLNAVYMPSAADTAAGSVTLTLTSTNNGGCLAVADQMVITITDAPVANAGADQTVCSNNANVTLNGYVAVATGGAWSTLGSGTFAPDSSALNATYIPSAADTAAGSVMLVLTTTGNAGCNAVTDTMIINISPAPVANAGADQIKCKASPNATLAGSISGSGTGVWSTSGTGTFSPNNTALNATYIPSTADTTIGMVTLVLTVSSPGCNLVTDTMTITYTIPPTVIAGADQVVCANNAAVTLNGSVTNGATTGIWTSSGSGTFTPSATDLNATYMPSAADTAAGSVTLTLTSSNSCVPITDNLIVTITDAPVVNAGGDVFVCANNPSASFSGNVSGGASTGQWASNGDGTFSSNTSFSVTYNPGPADIASGSVIITLTSTGNGQCLAVTDTMILTITPPPAASAGSDMFICANGTAALSGAITGGSGSGAWSSSGSGSFSPDNTTLNTMYIPSNADTAAGSVTLVLTSINNLGCTAVTDTMLLTITDGPTADAGTDQTVCANNSAVTLNGIVTVSTGGNWTTLGDGTFSDSTSLGTIYTPGANDITAGSATLVLTTTGNGNCVPVTDTIVVSITPAPVVNAGADMIICTGTSTVILNGSVTGGATTGQWTTLGTGFFTPDDVTMNATYNLSAADTAAGMVMLVLNSTNNGSCLAESDTIMITITTVPVTAAGADQTVCANNSAVMLSGSVTGGAGTGTWSTSGDGTFTPDNVTLNATYNPGPNDSLTGNVMLVLTATQACLANTDTLVVTITPAPVVNAGNDQTICGGNGVQLSGSVTVASGAMWTTSGDGTFMPNDSTLNAMYVPGPNDISSGIAILWLTSTGNGLCNAVMDSMSITIGGSPVAAISNTNLCNGVQAAFNDASTTPTGTIVSWQWDVDNGNVFSTQNISYTFNTTGVHTVQLVVANNAGCTDTLIQNVYVNTVPTASFASISNCNSDSVLFNDLSTIGSGTITGWSWNFGDSATSILQNPSHSYDSTGVYLVTLTVTSDSGCVSVFSDTILTNDPAVASFTSTTNCSLTVAFNNGSTTAANDSITSWTWSFGDSNTSTQQSPSHTYAASGTYTVTLIINTAAGCSDTMTAPVTVDVPPVAAFSGAGTYTTGQPVTFTDQSTNATAWYWDFGDNAGTSFQQDTTYSYTTAGTYLVMLTVSNAAGCMDTIVGNVVITEMQGGVVAVPSAFTPNGDGVNDVLFVRGGPFTELEFRIFNEWGNQIFMATDQSQGWDGTRSGTAQPAGTYIYTIIGRTLSGEEVKMSGDVTIIR
jgi:gliding motility-associated-like protein